MSAHDPYLEWLISQIRFPKDKTYNELCERMHATDFLWVIPNDDNRVQDGLDLRSEFFDGRNPNTKTDIVSVLELLIGLSRRVAFIAGEAPDVWAWNLIRNLRLHRMSDPLTEQQSITLTEILYSLVWRTYRQDGVGGFFPLKNPSGDQTKLELWYQMNEYVNEMSER